MDGGSWHCTEGNDQGHPQKKKYKKAKWLSEEDLQMRKEEKLKAKEKRKDIAIWMQSSKDSKER